MSLTFVSVSPWIWVVPLRRGNSYDPPYRTYKQGVKPHASLYRYVNVIFGMSVPGTFFVLSYNKLSMAVASMAYRAIKFVKSPSLPRNPRYEEQKDARNTERTQKNWW